jgi:hypothetical protein
LQAVDSLHHGKFSHTLKWKIPPVVPQGQLPTISLQSKQCKSVLIDNFELKPKLTGLKTYLCDAESGRLSVAIEYPSANPALSSLIVYTDDSGGTQHIFSAPEKALIDIPLESSVVGIAAQYMVGGIKHILIGWDHLLFVLCLLIIAGNLRRTLIAITGFTLAHTITLILAGLDLISVPIVFIEILIALSIVILASEIIKTRRYKAMRSEVGRTASLSWRYPVLVATGFGFVHGFGFASVLADLGLPQNMKVSALLFFNIGVEVGQFMFIGMVLLISYALTKVFTSMVRQRFVTLGVYGIGLVSSYWMIQRLAFSV